MSEPKSDWRLITPDGVLAWAKDANENIFWHPSKGTWKAPDTDCAAAIAKAMRYKAVWEQHRDKLSHLANPSRYATINRASLNKGIQAFIHAMNRAEAGDADS